MTADGDRLDTAQIAADSLCISMWLNLLQPMTEQRLIAPLRLVAPPSHRAPAAPPQKLATQREAVASAKVLLGAEVYHLVATSSMKKGDVLTVRQVMTAYDTT